METWPQEHEDEDSGIGCVSRREQTGGRSGMVELTVFLRVLQSRSDSRVSKVHQCKRILKRHLVTMLLSSVKAAWTSYPLLATLVSSLGKQCRDDHTGRASDLRYLSTIVSVPHSTAPNRTPLLLSPAHPTLVPRAFACNARLRSRPSPVLPLSNDQPHHEQCRAR